MSFLESLYLLFLKEDLPTIESIVVYLSPIALAIILWIIFWPLWLDFVRSKNISKIKYTLLNIKLPKDIFKTPLAMEVFINSLYNASDGNKFAQWWKGEMRPVYSLELVSIGGDVRFFIRADDKRKANIMSVLYSLFPGIEISETEDYAMKVHFDPKKIRIWGAEFIFTKKNPFPIKTYIDYGLDKDLEEEAKVDPIVPLIEFLGSLGPEQQVWIQYIIRGHKDDDKKPGTIFGKTDLWKDEAKKEIDTILQRDPKTKVSVASKDKDGKGQLSITTEGEKDVVKALERSISKTPFDVGIRALYIDNKDKFSPQYGVAGIVSGFKHFSTENLNGFKPNGEKWHPSSKGVPWEDPRNKKRDMASKEVLEVYKRRAFFAPPYVGKKIVLNSEELATLFHFPGQVSLTPTLSRVPSKRGEAPANLPI